MGDQIQMNYDARVVQTVRNLKKIPSRHSDSNSFASATNQNLNSIEKLDEEKYFL